ncbi:hypothetical protein GCM10023339_06940 [Alloalcanivorax gelatiniphagus]
MTADGLKAGRASPAAPFTIVIPTLQRSPLLRELVNRLTSAPLVHEVVIINNASTRLDMGLPRSRVLDMASNIYVNPAWNLGADQARSPFIALCNDDILFDTRILDRVASRLRKGAGIIGPAPACVRDVDAPAPRLRRHPIFVPVYERPFAFGTLMFLERDSYVPIPDDLKVWRGDDYLFRRQTRRNFIMLGIDIQTHMSTTSSDKAFDSVKVADMNAFHEHHRADPYRVKFARASRADSAVRRTARRARRVARLATRSHA